MTTLLDDRAADPLARIRRVLALVRRRDAALVFAATTGAYLLAYLVAIGHLAPGFGGVGGFGVTVVDAPFRWFVRPARGPFAFRPVARVRLGPVTYLFSLNTLLGLGVAVLVGLNLALAYLAWTQPRACGLSPSAGVFAGVPALLSGSACCGPVVLVALGLQASGLLASAFAVLLPVSVVLLLGSLGLLVRRVDPAVTREG